MDTQSRLDASRISVTCPDMANRRRQFTSPAFPPELSLWLALRRVRRGFVQLRAPDLFVDRGHRIPEYLNVAMRELFDNGQVRLADNHTGDPQDVEITPSGEQRFAELDARYGLVTRKNRPTEGGASWS